MNFDIPSQPLANALATFGASTGFEVIVDGRRAHDLVSSRVVGELEPGEALRMLLVGTGLTVRDYGPGNVRLMAVPAAIVGGEFSPATSPHASYFAALQEMILQTICRIDAGALDTRQRAMMLWLAPSGAITRVKLLDTLEENGHDAALGAALERDNVGAPTPADLKQPITLVVRSRPAQGNRNCSGSRPELRRVLN
jgi:hypothetical protein